MGKPAAAGRNGSVTSDSPYENGHRTGRSCARISVELEGVEPSSKQGTRGLSTRLSFDRSSCRDLAEGDPVAAAAYEISRPLIGVATAIPVSMIPRIPRATGRSARRGTRSTDSSDRGIKPFYSVKLSSECVAIIAICNSSIQFYESPHNARRAYHQTLPAVKTGQSLIALRTVFR